MYSEVVLFLFFPSVILSIACSLYSLYWTPRFKRTEVERREFNAHHAARSILKSNKISGVRIHPIEGEMTDHYNHAKKTLYLSRVHMKSNTVYAIAVAVHDAAHAVMELRGHRLPRLRSAIFGTMKIISNIALPVFLIGLGFRHDLLIQIGIVLFIVVVAFHLATYPVEYRANEIALTALKKQKEIKIGDLRKIEKMLFALSIAYLGAVFTSLFFLFKELYMTHKEENPS